MIDTTEEGRLLDIIWEVVYARKYSLRTGDTSPRKIQEEQVDILNAFDALLSFYEPPKKGLKVVK